MTEVTIKEDIDALQRIFNINLDNMTEGQYAALLKLRNNPSYKRLAHNKSFEERYWYGFIVLSDVPNLVEGWLQSELAEQYLSMPPSSYPKFISITKEKRCPSHN